MKPFICPFCDATSLSYRWRKFRYDLVLCSNCELVFVYPLPTEQDISGLYEEDFFSPGASIGYADYDAAWRVKNYLLLVKAIKHFFPHTSRRGQDSPPGRILDVGCAKGDFLSVCPEEWEKYGVEFSRYAGQAAQRRFGSNIQICSLRESRFELESFDVITMWETINHAADPLGDLRKCQRLLKPHGLLALNVGDLTSWMAGLMGRYWYQVTPPFHIYYFTPRTMKYVLEKTGFKLLKINYAGKYASIAASLERFKDTTGWSWMKRLCQRLGSLPLAKGTFYVNLRDTMLVFAGKGS